MSPRFKKRNKLAPVKTRKELRKEKRQMKKLKTKEHFKNRKEKLKNPTKNPRKNYVQIKPSPPSDDNDEIESDIPDNESESEVMEKQTKQKPNSSTDKLALSRAKEQIALHSYEEDLKKKRIEQLQAANEEEDKTIRKYEKLLKLNKRKGTKKEVPTSFNDGLDYLLELCTPGSIQKMYSAAKEAAEMESDEDEWAEDISMATGKKTTKKKVKDELKESKKINRLKTVEEKYLGEEKEPEGMVNLEDFLESEDEAKVEEQDDMDESEMLESMDEEGESEEESLPPAKKLRQNESDDNVDLAELFKNKKSKKKLEEDSSSTWEDIYGRKRDKEGNVIEEQTSKYVPPHLRAKLEASADPKHQEKLNRLRKQLKGQINRLSEANIHKIVQEIESLYMQNARFDMNTCVTGLLVEALVSSTLAKERMVLEHVLLLAILHANVGNEVGAFFLETIVLKVHEQFKAGIGNSNVEAKELENYVLILSHMYTFKIISHALLYEILQQLTKEFCEKAIECILVILRSVGFSLRKDNPLALKEIISQLQNQAIQHESEIKDRSRVKFMLDILLAVKNNNVTKIPGYDSELSEHFKKIMKPMIAPGKYVASLNVSMEDILNVDKRGKWWLVGSAWMGDTNSKATPLKDKSESLAKFGFTKQLLDLAREQRMSTDDRRTVFCILLSASDYVDAFEKIVRASIKDHRVVVAVIIHCTLAEKDFKPYYAMVAQKFCEYDRKFRLGFQYSLWDRIKDLGSLVLPQIGHLAQFMGQLIQNGALPLSSLKVVEFADLDKRTLRFVRQIMLKLLLADKDQFEATFAKISPSVKLKSFKDSVRIFLQHFMRSKKVDPESAKLLMKRIIVAERFLQTDDDRF